MDTCAVEVGLLSKKPCGQPAATHCANCEMALCSKHAVPQLANGKKTGKYMCKECDAARKAFEKNVPADSEKKPAAPPPAGAAPAAKAPAAPAAVPAAKAPATTAPKPEAPKPGTPEKKEGYDGGIDFTPSKK